MTMGRPNGPSLNVIPLMTADQVMAPEQRDEAMRSAVLQVIDDLVVERVPLENRLPFFEAAKELLPQAGLSPVEMLEAIEPGPQQDSLFAELGLLGDVDE
jgi:hypothetical protein